MEQTGPNGSDQQANLEDRIQAKALQDEDHIEQPSKGALALEPNVGGESSYRVETRARIPDTQMSSCFNHKEMLKSILA